ncbi:MAG: fumarylacetoacetate hydrolase family protein [Alcanivoracaceae bacterium]|nr:fumarylacetoacetate hydrolase family protein [Alcanivoracaceae bacterium]
MKTVTINKQKVIPSKVVCIGRNYVEHIKELNNETPDSMVIFNKPNSSISDTLYYFDKYTRYEGEICFLIKDKQLAGVGFGLDLTKADIQNEMKKKGLPWERAKAFDNSAVLSDFATLNTDVRKLRMELFINDKLVQKANYDLMMYKPQQIIAEIKSFMHLQDGDIIMTGTPKGVGTFDLNDVFVGKIYDGKQLIVESQWQAEKQ